MTGAETRAWLEQEIAIFPERAPGEELYAYLIKRTASLVESDRCSLVKALAEWLKLRSEPRTMLAVEIAKTHHLAELRNDIEELLDDVRKGRAFKSFYQKPISDALNEL